jgi:hypothetical protein
MRGHFLKSLKSHGYACAKDQQLTAETQEQTKITVINRRSDAVRHGEKIGDLSEGAYPLRRRAA